MSTSADPRAGRSITLCLKHPARMQPNDPQYQETVDYIFYRAKTFRKEAAADKADELISTSTLDLTNKLRLDDRMMRGERVVVRRVLKDA